MYREALANLSQEDLIALVLAQAAQIATLTAQIEELIRRIAELEAKLGQPPKTPDNSSLPPSRGAKPNQPERGRKPGRKGRAGRFRRLADNPDRIAEAFADHGPHCAHGLTPADQPGVHAYDPLDLPPPAFAGAGFAARGHPRSPPPWRLPVLPPRLALGLHFLGRVGVDHVGVISADLVVELLRRVGRPVAVLMHRAALDRRVVPQGGESPFPSLTRHRR